MKSPASHKKEWVLTQEEFDRLLLILDQDAERAGEKYEHIRRGLILFFQSRRCLTPEDLADETIDRATRRINEGVEIYASNPFLYFYGIALRVLQEYHRKLPSPLPPPASVDPAERELKLECMDRCLQELGSESRNTLTEYCVGDFHERIDKRRQMAERMGVSLNTLRIRVHRLREQLERCVKNCLQEREE
jgi:DNA-directed RNA polymerase specialized sigma24 family protein